MKKIVLFVIMLVCITNVFSQTLELVTYDLSRKFKMSFIAFDKNHNNSIEEDEIDFIKDESNVFITLDYQYYSSDSSNLKISLINRVNTIYPIRGTNKLLLWKMKEEGEVVPFIKYFITDKSCNILLEITTIDGDSTSCSASFYYLK